MDVILAIVIILSSAGVGYCIHHIKSRLDAIEQAQRDHRLPYRVAEDTEDIIAIQLRATRQIREVRQTIDELGLFLDAMANELERTLDKAREIRSNGQKGKRR